MLDDFLTNQNHRHNCVMLEVSLFLVDFSTSERHSHEEPGAALLQENEPPEKAFGTVFTITLNVRNASGLKLYYKNWKCVSNPVPFAELII